MIQGKTTEESRVRKAAEKIQTFDTKKEKQMFEEARREFRGDHVTPCFPQSVKRTILAKNYGRLKDVNV
jgi:chorismate mutase